jgi:hypothetical protein
MECAHEMLLARTSSNPDCDIRRRDSQRPLNVDSRFCGMIKRCPLSAETRNSNFARAIIIRVGRCVSRAEASRSSVGSVRFRAATERKLTDGSLDVEFDSRHLFEQLDIRDPDRTYAEPHAGRHQVEGLGQYADVLENERIGDRAVLP